jgi:hypothetical protein
MDLTEEEERMIRTHRIETELRKLKDIPGLLKDDLSGLTRLTKSERDMLRPILESMVRDEPSDE